MHFLLLVCSSSRTMPSPTFRFQMYISFSNRLHLLSPPTFSTVEFAGEALQELLNLILNKAVVGSCGKLCSALVNATHNPKLGTPCTILCDLVGIKAFVNWIQKADLSPYYDCEELGVCKTNDYGDATITSWLATPSELAAGPPVTLSFTYDSKNGTSTGEIRIGVKTVDHQDLSFNSIYIADSTTGGSFKGSGQIQSTTPASPS